MIEPRELRIGNYVKHKWIDENGILREFIKVFAVCGNSFISVDSNMLPEYETIMKVDIKPIPLTEKIILKCGFKWVKRFECYVHGYKTDKEFILQKQDSYWLICDIDLEVRTKHLHQLQNIYYSLTGKELEIEL